MTKENSGFQARLEKCFSLLVAVKVAGTSTLSVEYFQTRSLETR